MGMLNSSHPECNMISNFAEMVHARNRRLLSGSFGARGLQGLLDISKTNPILEHVFTKRLKTDWRNTVNTIEEKIATDQDLTKKEIKFLKHFAYASLEGRAKLNEEDLKVAKAHNASVDYKMEDFFRTTKVRESDLITKYSELIPAAVRPQLNNQLVSICVELVTQTIEAAERLKNSSDPSLQAKAQQYIGKTFAEVLEMQLKADSETGSKLFNNVYKYLQKTKEKNIPDFDYTYVDLLLNNQEAWEAAVFMAKSLLGKALNMKIGMTVGQIESQDIQEQQELASGTTTDAEATTPERWQIKAETLSQFMGLSSEVRAALSTLVADDRRGVLGLVNLVDSMKVHNQLLNLYEFSSFRTSKEFIEKVEGMGTYWCKILANRLKADESLATKMFLAYSKPALHYHSHDMKMQYDKRTKVRARSLYRNSSDPSNLEISSEYAVRLLETSKEAAHCLFNEWGNFPPPKQQIIDNILTATRDGNPVPFETRFFAFILPQAEKEAFNAQFNAIEKDSDKEAFMRRAFVLVSHQSLNLRLSDEEIDRIVSSKKNYERYKESFEALLAAISERNFPSIRDMATSKSRKFRAFRSALAGVKGVATISTEVSWEGMFRFGKSSYAHHVIPSSLTERLNALAHAAREGRMREYLEAEYLKCPVYATRTADGYDIHNEWLRLLYEEASNPEAIKTPNTFTHSLLTKLSRGLGTNTTELESHSMQENYLYDIGEFFETAADNPGKCAVPLFVTGDSDSARYFEVEEYTVRDIEKKLREVLRNEIERVIMLKALQKRELEAGRDISNIHWLKDENIERSSYFPSITRAEFKALIEEQSKSELERDDAKIDELIDKYVDRDIRKKWNTFTSDLQKARIIKVEGIFAKNCTILPEAINVENWRRKSETDTDLLERYFYNVTYHTIQQLQFTTVDPSFYEGTQDAQKRYKEQVSSGIGLDLDATWNGVRVDNSGDMAGKQSCIYFDDMKSDFSNPSTVPSVFRPFVNYLVDKLGLKDYQLEVYKKTSLTDGQAYRSFGSYRKIQIMNGTWSNAKEAAYDKIIEFRTNVKEGKYTTEEELRNAKKDLIKTIQDLGVVFMPLKPFYFGFETIKENGFEIKVPVQHKYSEWPLIPELYPASPKLEMLAKAMEESNTEIALASSCVKVGGFKTIRLEDYSDSQSLSAAMQGNVHTLPLTGFRVQNNVPEHVNSSRARGTQFTKHGYANMSGSKNKKYSFMERILGPTRQFKIDGNTSITIGLEGMSEKDLMRIYGALGASGYVRSTRNLLNKQLKDAKSISNSLLGDRCNNGRSSINDMLSVTLTEVDGRLEFTTPLNEGVNAADNFTALMSMFKNKIIKQSFKGGSCVQISGYGFEEDLAIHMKDGVPSYAECAMAFDFNYIDEKGNSVEIDYLDYVDPITGYLLDEDGKPLQRTKTNDGSLGEFDLSQAKIEKDFPGILDLVAYRIPTEKLYSTLNLKTVKFFPKAAGGVIAVPTPYTAIAGFDFDIDKLYYVRREYRKGKDGKFDRYDTSKTVEQNSQTAVNNLLFDFYQARLEDPDTAPERYTPGGFHTLKHNKPLMMLLNYAEMEDIDIKGCRTLAELMGRLKDTVVDDPRYAPNYDITNPSTAIHYRTNNSMYSRLIGASANQSINLRLTALVDAWELKKAIKIGSCVTSSDPKAGKDIKARMVNGMDTELLVTEFLAASVDAVKDALLEFYGINPGNFSIACSMARVGHSATDIGLFLNQPILLRATQIQESSPYYMSFADALQAAKVEMFGDKLNNYRISSDAIEPLLTQDKLVSYLCDPNPTKPSENFIMGQLAVAMAFGKFQEVASELGEEINASKGTSTNSYQNEAGTFLAREADIYSFAAKLGSSSSLFNVLLTSLDSTRKAIVTPQGFALDDILGNVSTTPFSMEEAAYACSKIVFDRICEFFPYRSDAFRTVFSAAKDFTSVKRLSPEVYNALINAATMYIVQRELEYLDPSAKARVLTADGTYEELPFSNKLFYEEVFPALFSAIINTNEAEKGEVRYSKIPILQTLKAKFDKNRMVVRRTNVAQGETGMTKDVLSASIDFMLQSDDIILQNLGTQLMLYGIFNAGFKMSGYSIMHLASPLAKSLLDDLGRDGLAYLELFRSMPHEQAKHIDLRSFFMKFFINNPDLYQFTKRLNHDQNTLIEKRRERHPNSFTIEIGEDGKIFDNLGRVSEDGKTVTFVPCVVVGYGPDAEYFVAYNPYSSDHRFNVNSGGNNSKVMTYHKVSRTNVADYSDLDLSSPEGWAVTEDVDNPEIKASVERIVKAAADHVIESIKESRATAQNEDSNFDNGEVSRPEDISQEESINTSEAAATNPVVENSPLSIENQIKEGENTEEAKDANLCQGGKTNK